MTNLLLVLIIIILLFGAGTVISIAVSGFWIVLAIVGIGLAIVLVAAFTMGSVNIARDLWSDRAGHAAYLRHKAFRFLIVPYTAFIALREDLYGHDNVLQRAIAFIFTPLLYLAALAAWAFVIAFAVMWLYVGATAAIDAISDLVPPSGTTGN